MAFASSLRGYGAIIKETTAGTPVKPTNYFRFESESIVTGYESETLPTIQNSRSLNLVKAKGKNAAPTGTISLPVQMPTIGMFLTGSLGAPSSSGPVDSVYTHEFTSNAAGTIATYTVDIGNTDLTYVRRYVGCRFGGIKFSIKNNVWYAEFTLMARYAFNSAKIAANTTAPTTTVTLDSTHGITTSDTLTLGLDTANEEDVTVSNVNADGITLTTSATAKNHTAGDLVVIKSSSPSYSTATHTFEWMGGTTTKVGTTLAGAASSSIFQDFTLDMSQGLEPIYAPGGTGDFARFPVEVAVKGYGSNASTRIHHQGMEYEQYIKDRTEIALDFYSAGLLVGTTATDLFEVQIPGLRINPRAVSMGGDNVLQETISGNCSYNSTSGFDIKVILKNATASY